MPRLNRDLLREVLYELIQTDGSCENTDKFMLTGKDPFKLVLDICRKANDVVIFGDKIAAKFPGIQYDKIFCDNEDDDEEQIFGTGISTEMFLFKPISIAFASSLKSLNIRSFSPALIPMLKFIDRGNNICLFSILMALIFFTNERNSYSM